MWHYLNTVIADTAVRAARWTIKLACCAPFHAHCDSFDIYILVKWCTEIIISYLIVMSWNMRGKRIVNNSSGRIKLRSLRCSVLDYENSYIFHLSPLDWLVITFLASEKILQIHRKRTLPLHLYSGRRGKNFHPVLSNYTHVTGNEWLSFLPLGYVPGSMKVANPKLITAKRARRPW